MSFADAMTSARSHDVVLVSWSPGVFAVRVDGELVGAVDGEFSMLAVHEELTRIVLARGGDPTRMRVRFAARAVAAEEVRR